MNARHQPRLCGARAISGLESSGSLIDRQTCAQRLPGPPGCSVHTTATCWLSCTLPLHSSRDCGDIQSRRLSLKKSQNPPGARLPCSSPVLWLEGLHAPAKQQLLCSTIGLAGRRDCCFAFLRVRRCGQCEEEHKLEVVGLLNSAAQPSVVTEL